MTPTVLWMIAAVVVLAAVVFVLMRLQSAAHSVPVDAEDGARWMADDGEAHLVERDPEIRWSGQIGAPAETLDDDARLRLLTDLGLIHAAWMVPILQQAYVEERRPSHRRAALLALAACHHPDAQSTLEIAAQSPDNEERAVAMNALRTKSTAQDRAI